VLVGLPRRRFSLNVVAALHLKVDQVFAGIVPYTFIIATCEALLKLWQGLANWLPLFL
jgi:TRAP-type mannitol/chloroaromatic compound transport system permease large subunit